MQHPQSCLATITSPSFNAALLAFLDFEPFPFFEDLPLAPVDLPFVFFPAFLPAPFVVAFLVGAFVSVFLTGSSTSTTTFSSTFSSFLLLSNFISSTTIF